MQFLKFFGAPGSLTFLAVCTAFGLLLILGWPRNRRLGQTWLLLVFGTYVLLGIPYVANTIAGRLRPVSSDKASWRTIDCLIVLDGDNRWGRVRRTLEVDRLASLREIWILGTEHWLVETLPEQGIERNRIRTDLVTPTTRAQMAHVAYIAAPEFRRHVGVIASRLQMPRVVALARASGAVVIPVPSPVDDEPAASGISQFVPSYYALRVSRDALYEHAALVYYMWRGWISAT